MALKKTTQDIVGAGGRALGFVVPAAFGFEYLRLVDGGSRKLRRRR